MPFGVNAIRFSIFSCGEKGSAFLTGFFGETLFGFISLETVFLGSVFVFFKDLVFAGVGWVLLFGVGAVFLSSAFFITFAAASGLADFVFSVCIFFFLRPPKYCSTNVIVSS